MDILHRSLDAFVKRDVDVARRIVAKDDQADHLHDQVFRGLLAFVAEDPKAITRVIRLIWGAHNLEGSADGATNIRERVVCIVIGKMEGIGISKYEEAHWRRRSRRFWFLPQMAS